MVQKIAGIDVGYRYTVGVHGDARRKFPSVIALASHGSLDFDLIESKAMIEYLGQRYLVGEQAAHRSRQAERTIDHSRTGTAEYKLLFLTALLGLYPEGGRVYVVTGLPMGEIHLAGQVENDLSGKHTIRTNGSAAKFDLTCKVIPQTLGTLTRETFAIEGRTLKVRNADLMRKSSLVVDWGGLTDGYQRFIGRDLIEDQSGSTDTGMVRVLNHLIAYAAREHNLRLSLDDADEALRTGGIELNTGSLDLTSAIAELLDQKAQASARVAKSYWGDGRQDKYMFMTGGGAYHLPKFFSKYYQHGNAVTVRTPDMANAEGFYIYGLGLDLERKWT